MVAAHLLKIPFLKAYDQVVILRIPVVKRGDMKAAVKTVELIVFVSDFFVSRVRKQDDALMAAARNGNQTYVFNVAVQRHLSVDLENNRAFELVQCHTFLDFMESFRDVNYLADMAGAHHIVLTCRVESGWTVDSDVGAVFGDDREAEIVVHVLMRGDKGSYLTVGEHFVDAFALEALIHPHVVPAAVKQVLRFLAVQSFDFNETGVAACVVGMLTQFTSDFPSFFQIFRKVRSDIFHTVFISSFAGAFTVAEGRPVIGVLVNQQTAGSRDVLHKDAVVKPACFGNVGDLDGFAQADVSCSAFNVRKKGRAGG